MQNKTNFLLDIYDNILEVTLSERIFPLHSGDRIFFIGDLGSGKSTFIRHLLRSHFHNDSLIVRSPTYTYYQKYGENIYHFDLYRLESLEDFYFIGGQDIIDNPNNICLIEWPEILGESVSPNKKISITTNEDGSRRFEISTRRAPATE